jgi:hypothetical protein
MLSFVNWNMPFGLNILKHSISTSHPSPMSWTGDGLGNLQVCTPADYKTPLADHVSPADYISPRSAIVRERSALERTDLFLKGDLNGAINSMSDMEKL